MIKLFEILKEITNNTINLDGVKFYHGTVQYEIKNPSELNPLFRESSVYKKMQANNWTRKSSGSSYSGVGIYFGRTPNEHGTEDALQYYNPKAYLNRAYSRGFLYEMTLKPNSKIVVHPDYVNLGKNTYEELRKEGVDAVSEGYNTKDGLNLINPNAVATWKEVDRWEQPFDVILFKFNEETDMDKRVETKRFWEWTDAKTYISEQLGIDKNDLNPAPKSYNSPDPNNLYSIVLQRPVL